MRWRSIRALQQLHLVVVGRRRAARVAAATRGARSVCNGRVHFLGARRDLGNILGAVDLFTMPSLWEGLPLSLVLAMGAGLPVVATRVAGIPEVVQHDVSGLLVSPGKSDELARRAGARWSTTRRCGDRSASGRARS